MTDWVPAGEGDVLDAGVLLVVDLNTVQPTHVSGGGLLDPVGSSPPSVR
ncbi:MAG: hypothetical protein ABIO48_01245 [Pedococcus sp.]